MRCKYCFARFLDVKETVLPKGHLGLLDSIRTIKALSDFGFTKITFVGGEPTLCSWLPDLVKFAKQKKMTTCIVTNGSKIDDEYLSKFNNSIDWITISLDSFNPNTIMKIGRHQNGKMVSWADTLRISETAKKHGINFKINTVVNSFNKDENLAKNIDILSPKRWKIFQALEIRGQNSDEFDEISISNDDFEKFIQSNVSHNKKIDIIPENNELMTGSYIMVDPAGRFFDNVEGTYKYSKSILDDGVSSALSEIEIIEDRFYDRNGFYDWKRAV